MIKQLIAEALELTRALELQVQDFKTFSILHGKQPISSVINSEEDDSRASGTRLY